MIDLNDPYTLNILLMGSLVIITLLVLYILVLRRKVKELAQVCSTDFQLHRVLRITDELLGKLPNSEVESFVTSPDFEIYKEALKPVVLGHKNVPEPPKIPPKIDIPEKVPEPEKKIEVKPVEKPTPKKPETKKTKGGRRR